MKKILYLLLLIPSLAFSQLRLPYSYLLQNYHGDTSKVYFSGDLLKWHITKDTLDIDVPIKSQGHLLGSGSGSTVYANSGLYKDSDTVKLSNSVYIPSDSTFQILHGNIQTFLTGNNQTFMASSSGTKAIVLDDNMNKVYINGAALSVYSATSPTMVTFQPYSGAVRASIDSFGNASFSGRITQAGTYAGIYVTDGAAAQTIATGTTYTKMTCFASNGLASNCTSDQANDKITITKVGKYYLNWSMSASIGTNNVTFSFTAFQGGTELAPTHSRRKISTLGDVGAFGGQGFINVTSVPIDIDLRCRHDNGGGVDITPVYANLTVQYVGE